MADDCADGCGLWKWHLVASRMSFTAHVTTHECSGQNVASAVEFMQNPAFICYTGIQDAGECVHARRISTVVGFFFFDQCPLLFHSLVLPLKLTLSSQTLKAQLRRRYLLFFFFFCEKEQEIATSESRAVSAAALRTPLM